MSTGKPSFRGVDEDILVPIVARLDTIRTSLGDEGQRALLENINREMSDLRHRFRCIDRHEKDTRQSFDRVEELIDDALQRLQDQSQPDGHHNHEKDTRQSFDRVEEVIDDALQRLQDQSQPDGHHVYHELRLREVEKLLGKIKGIVNDCYNLQWKDKPDEQAPEKRMASAAATTRTITKRMQEIRHGPQTRLLRLSVGGLEARMRGCVLCLAAFPEGAVIKKRLLIHWWIGEGFVRSADEGKKRFDELADKGFLIRVRRGLCGTAHRCVVRPWMRDLLVDVARSDAFLDPDSGNDFSVTRRACLRGGKITSSKFDDELRAIYNIDRKYVELDKGWFAGKKELHALQLGQWRELGPSEQIEKPEEGHVEVSGTERFADMAESCKKLRYISFRGISRIDSLPDAIGGLRELVVLDLRACHNLENLGEGIVYLENLEYLDVSDCHLLVGMPRRLGILNKLEVLKGFVVASSNTMGVFCGLSDMNKNHKITGKLRKLSISISKMDDTTEVELRSLVNFKAVESLTITWGVVDSKESKRKGTNGGGENITPATIAEKEGDRKSSVALKKGHEGTPLSSTDHEDSAKEGGNKKAPTTSEKEGDGKASAALQMEGDEEAQGTSQKIGSDQEEEPFSSGKEGVIDAPVTSDNKVDEESTKKEGVEESPGALKEPDEQASKVNSKKEDDEAALAFLRKKGVEDAPVATDNKVDKESTKKESNGKSPVALKKEPDDKASKMNSKKEDDEAALASFRKEGIEDAPVTTDNKVDKESTKEEGDEISPEAREKEPDEETSKVNPNEPDGEGSETFKKAGSEETLAVTSNKEHGKQALVPGDHDEASKKIGNGQVSAASKGGGDGWIAKMKFALPPKLKKLDLRCFPLTEIPNWDGLKNTVRKLYIRGGKLTSLGDGETWKAEVLRLRFLKDLRYDHDKFTGSFKELKHECVEIHECPKFNHPWKQDKTGSQGGAAQAEAR